jgi:hydroxymethylpyrimidine pyrophosphatase-like HAD family hydrolase
MGNAVDELKAIAHYIAPSYIDDGIIDVINKYYN